MKVKYISSYEIIKALRNKREKREDIVPIGDRLGYLAARYLTGAILATVLWLLFLFFSWAFFSWVFSLYK